MSTTRLEEEVGAILEGARDTLRVTRARCYAMGPRGDFRLAASYGFGSRFGPDDLLDSEHPLVDWVQRVRRPVFANSPGEAGPLGRHMEREQYARTLALPVYVGSRLVGIVEFQDKVNGGFFASEDLRAAERLGTRIATVLESHNGTSVAPEPLAPEDAEALFQPPPPAEDADDFPPPPPLFSNDFGLGTAEAGPAPAASAPAPRQTPDPGQGVPAPGREELVFRGTWSSLLLSPDVEAVAFSTWAPEGAVIRVGARRGFSDEARAALIENLEGVIGASTPAAAVPEKKRFVMEYPVGRGPGQIQGFAGIQTSELAPGPPKLLLSILFSNPPEAAAEGALKEVHRGVRAAVLQTSAGDRYRHSYRSLVKALLEPGLRAYPQLKAHSYAVGALCRRFAAALVLPADGIEQLTVAGLLHDIGIREVEIPYERLSGRRPLDIQEVALVRRHASIGADILEKIDFPYPVAPLVRHHHERFDGAGYPDGLTGERIPFGSRVLAIAEAYDAMTAHHSYRNPIASEAALEIISVKAGSQFDPELARRFTALLRRPMPDAGGER
jgi:putative nucleotidyltransferase with HDIG domain